MHSFFRIKRKNRRRPNFPGSFPPSIFSARELNFCVRDGYRWILSAIVTGFPYVSRLASAEPLSSEGTPSTLNNSPRAPKPFGQVFDLLVSVS